MPNVTATHEHKFTVSMFEVATENANTLSLTALSYLHKKKSHLHIKVIRKFVIKLLKTPIQVF